MAGFNTSFKIEGLEELAQKLEKIPEAMRESIARKATGTAAAIIRDEAKAIAYRAPKPYPVYNTNFESKTVTWVEPGHVARNIIMKRIPPNERRGLLSQHIVVISMSQELPYGARNIGTFIEYGINQPEPRPFMRPAYENKKDVALSAAEKVIDSEIRKIWNQQ